MTIIILTIMLLLFIALIYINATLSCHLIELLLKYLGFDTDNVLVSCTLFCTSLWMSYLLVQIEIDFLVKIIK